MKRKFKITAKMVKRTVLLVLLVAVVGLLVYLTIDSFDKDIVSSNSSIPVECKISGEYKKYVYSKGDTPVYPTGVKAEATLNQAETDLKNSTNGTDEYTGKSGSFTDPDGVNYNFVYSGEEGSLIYDVDVPQAGFYNILVKYVAMDEKMNGDTTHTWEASGGADMEREFKVNGEVPFDDLSVITFTRSWHDGGKVKTDLNGNEIKPSQVELQQAREDYVKDSIGYITEPYLVYFEAGANKIEINSIRENMGIIGLWVTSKESHITYEEYKASNPGNVITGSKTIKIEGESSTARSTSTIYAVSDKTSLYTTTTNEEGESKNASPLKQILNTIGGNKWTLPGSWITWEFEVEETGLYEISMRCKQNVSRGLFSTRKLYIDGKVPFSEAQNCKYVYQSDYSVVTLGANDDTPYLFYFEAGKKHTITLECTLGDYASLISDVQDVIDRLNSVYRGIIKRTGISPDPYINYFAKEEGQAFIKESQQTFRECTETLTRVSNEITAISGEKSSEASSLETMVVQLEQFIKSYRKIQKSLSDFSTNIASLGTWILNVSQQALTIDFIEVHTSDYTPKRANPNLFTKTWFTIKGFVGSFFTDYESVGLTSGNQDDEEVEVWLLTSESTGREQANAISSMIYEAKNDAENNVNNPLHGINVKLKCVSAGVLLTATLANRGPDVAINVANGTPVNYALRGAIHDLTKYIEQDKAEAASKGTKAVIDRFANSSLTPYKYTKSTYQAAATKEEGLVTGTYALPYTQSYLVMFYRTDMFEEYGWTVPETWDQVLQLIPELQIMNFQFYLPLNQAGATSVVNQIFASYLYQHVQDTTQAFYRSIPYQTSEGYWQEYIESNFDSEDAMKAFEFWCSFYTDFSFPLAASFVNRFRTGETPIGIAGFDMYNTLAVSAPEIKGKWKFALLPGTEVTKTINGNEKTFIDHTGATSGTCLVMMEQPSSLSEAEKEAKYDASWKFMDWFTSADTQVGFAREIEAILGSAARLNTANVEAFDRLAWTKDDLEVLDKQREGVHTDDEEWTGTVGVPEVPGGYYTGRNLENAFRFVVNNNENPRQTLTDYILSINNEINRKRDEFNLGTIADYKKSANKN